MTDNLDRLRVRDEHLAQWAVVEIERLSADNATLRDALQTQAEEAAKLMEQRDELLAALEAAEELHRVGLIFSEPGQIQRVNDLRQAAITNATTN
jgi:predicted nuclease with TOPRIM domain